jgi:hypothetical protein
VEGREQDATVEAPQVQEALEAFVDGDAGGEPLGGRGPGRMHA